MGSDPFDSRALVLSELCELGYLEGQNIVIEYRSSEGRNDQLAAELVGSQVEIILAIATPAAQAAKEVT